jgi:AraC family transcriptional regulator
MLPSEARQIAGLAAWQLRIAKEYLEDDYAHEVRLASLAQLTGLSQSWFARRFKASTGIAPYTWALQLRVSRAKEFLLKNDQPISAIAIEVGFADQSHFTKAFKRFTGATPRSWRKARMK